MQFNVFVPFVNTHSLSLYPSFDSLSVFSMSNASTSHDYRSNKYSISLSDVVDPTSVNRDIKRVSDGYERNHKIISSIELAFVEFSKTFVSFSIITS